MRYEQKAELQDSNKARMYEEKKKQMSSEKQIKQLKKEVMFYTDFQMRVLKADYNQSTFSKSDIEQTFKELKEFIKHKFNRLKYVK